MPGVGITDAELILGLVAQHRSQVALSVVLQLVSAAAYAPAMIGLVTHATLGADRHVRIAAVLLLVGAMGSAADAVFHLFAYAMTSPDLDPTGFLPLMQFVQGPGLRFVLPLIAAFFVGSVWLSVACARLGIVPRANPMLFPLALVVAIVGALAAPAVGVPARIVGLVFLGMVSAAQAWIGVRLFRMDA
jgi:hypothetical protein